MDIGTRIQYRRKELNLSVDDVAKRLNKNRTTVYRYEKGEIGNLPLEMLKPLADILKTTPAYLMGWEEHSIEETQETEPEKISFLIELFTRESFTCEEYDNMVEYARFLVYRRSLK